MSHVTISDLHVRYGAVDTLGGVSLDIPSGSFVAVLGPSGCGKTTLLRAIAGLLAATSGTIHVDGRLFSSADSQVPPERRGIGLVPQDALLFPHLDVGENIGFGLPRAGREPRVAELAALVGLDGLTDRSPAQLSGGQAHRVALARALAPQPGVILLDEPFAALDPQLRNSLRNEVAELLRVQRNTTLLVTHDQEEALSLADYIAVMRDGRILQWGTPAEIYGEPASRWIAGFVGDTVELDGHWAGTRVACALGEIDVVDSAHAALAGAPVRLVIRPEWLRIGDGGTDATVTGISFAGHDALVTLTLTSGEVVSSRVASPGLPRRGDATTVSLRHRALAYDLG